MKKLVGITIILAFMVSLAIPFIGISVAVAEPLDLQVNASADDAWEDGPTGAMNLTSENVWVVTHNATYNHWGGFRWSGLNIPQNATITSCIFEGWFVYGDILVDVFFENGSAPAAFTTGNNNIQNRTLTTANVTWNDTSIMYGWESPPDLTTVLQEVVDSHSITSLVLILKPPTTGTSSDAVIEAADVYPTFAAKLSIEYAVTPSITTNNATYVTRTTAQLNSYLNDDGGEDCDIRFQYGTATGNYTSNTSWINDTYATGSSPYVSIAALAINTTYYFRVQVKNANATVNGSELDFTTALAIYPPTNFVAYPNSTAISLTWIKGIGTTYTMIRGQTGGYPVNYTDGTQVYAGSMSTALHSNLTPGTTYYFRSWSYDSISYSANYTDILMTTLASEEDVTETPAAPSTPSNWWGIPNYTNMENIAGYGIINTIADNFEIPRNTFWMSGIILLIMIIGLFIYSVQHNATVAIVLTGVLIVVASIAGLLPLFMIVLVVVPTASIMLVKRRI